MMSGRVFWPKIQKARKNYKCDWCNGVIAAGTKYYKASGFEKGFLFGKPIIRSLVDRRHLCHTPEALMPGTKRQYD